MSEFDNGHLEQPNQFHQESCNYDFDTLHNISPEYLAELKINELVGLKIQINDALTDARRLYNAFEALTKSKIIDIHSRLNEIAVNLGVDSFKTENGTAFRTYKDSFRVQDWNQVIEFIKATDNFQILEKRVGKVACKEIQESGEDIPGVEYAREVDFTIRRPSKR